METCGMVLYDCCAFYGHHEYDLGMFRAARYRTNKTHVRAYHKLSDVKYVVLHVLHRICYTFCIRFLCVLLISFALILVLVLSRHTAACTHKYAPFTLI